MGIEDEQTDPALCVCSECLEAAKVKSLIDKHHVVEVSTLYNPRSGSIGVYVLIEGEVARRFAQGSKYIDAIEAALAQPAPSS